MNRLLQQHLEKQQPPPDFLETPLLAQQDSLRHALGSKERALFGGAEGGKRVAGGSASTSKKRKYNQISCTA